MKEGRKPEHPEKTPGDELQKKKISMSLTLPTGHGSIRNFS